MVVRNTQTGRYKHKVRLFHFLKTFYLVDPQNIREMIELKALEHTHTHIYVN